MVTGGKGGERQGKRWQQGTDWRRPAQMEHLFPNSQCFRTSSIRRIFRLFGKNRQPFQLKRCVSHRLFGEHVRLFGELGLFGAE